MNLRGKARIELSDGPTMHYYIMLSRNRVVPVGTWPAWHLEIISHGWVALGELTEKSQFTSHHSLNHLELRHPLSDHTVQLVTGGAQPSTVLGTLRRSMQKSESMLAELDATHQSRLHLAFLGFFFNFPYPRLTRLFE
jgi:hypothetical protein